MKKLIMSVFFLLTFLVPSAFTHAAGSGVSGAIDKDTVWTVENSPYYLQGNITIKSGANLRIESGVKIVGSGFRIDLIDGSFNTLGTKRNPVYIEKIRLNSLINSGRREINLNYTKLEAGSMTIQPTSFNLIGSTLNSVKSNIHLGFTESDTHFNYNIVNLGNMQIIDFSNNIKTYIGHNLFYTGFSPLGNHSIKFGGKNTTGVPDLSMKYNTFLSGNNKFVIKSSATTPIKAVNNYWNTINEDTITSKFQGGVIYKPYLTAPDPRTPSLNVLTLSETTPADKKIGVELNSSVTFRFNREIVAGKGFNGIKFRDKKGVSVKFTKSIKGDKLVLTPSEPLSPNTQYTVSIPKSSVQATDGTKIVEPGGDQYIWFRTNFQ